VKSAQACRYVDEVLYDDVPLVLTKEFLEKHKIDIVAHGDDFDKEKLTKYYGVPIELGIFRTIPYTTGISTTDILNRIKERVFPDSKYDGFPKK